MMEMDGGPTTEVVLVPIEGIVASASESEGMGRGEENKSEELQLFLFRSVWVGMILERARAHGPKQTYGHRHCEKCVCILIAPIDDLHDVCFVVEMNPSKAKRAKRAKRTETKQCEAPRRSETIERR